MYEIDVLALSPVDLTWPDWSYCWVQNEIELGEALFDPLEPGSYTLTVRSSGCESVTTTVAIEAGVTRELELHLPAAEGDR